MSLTINTACPDLEIIRFAAICELAFKSSNGSLFRLMQAFGRNPELAQDIFDDFACVGDSPTLSPEDLETIRRRRDRLDSVELEKQRFSSLMASA